MESNEVATYVVKLKPKCMPPKPPFQEERKDEIAKSAMKLENQVKITLTGDAQGAMLFDGSDDAVLRVTVKHADRADKDSEGNVISAVYVKRNELSKYLLRKEINQRLNAIEAVLYALKNAVNHSIKTEDFVEVLATTSDIDAMFDERSGENV